MKSQIRVPMTGRRSRNTVYLYSCIANKAVPPAEESLFVEVRLEGTWPNNFATNVLMTLVMSAALVDAICAAAGKATRQVLLAKIAQNWM